MDLLKVYESSSSDDEDKAFSNSDKNGETRMHHGKGESTKKKPRTSRVSIIDSNESNNLFVRSVPHVRGNWAGHVFIRLDECGFQKKQLHRAARQSILSLRTRLEKAGWKGSIVSHVAWPKTTTTCQGDNESTDSSEQDNEERNGLHLSLSRPFYLQLASIPSFVTELRQLLCSERAITVALNANDPEIVLVNEEGTRSFWCKPVTSTTVTRLIQHVNQVLLKYKQPPYYDPPKLHVSFASMPGNVKSLLEASHNGKEQDDTEAELVVIPIQRVHCTFGTTKEFSIDLME